MKRFVIDESFAKIFPDARIGVVVARGIDNTDEGARAARGEMTALLAAANADAKKYLTEEVFYENKVIAVWREAFRKFKTKRSVRCSIENLLKRAEKGAEVGAINSLVDIYNAISLEYALPVGGEDIDTFVGDLRLAVARGGEPFRALGDDEDDPALEGEVCYLDDVGAVCRSWNWRDGVRTMLTERTKNAFLIIESVDPSRDADLEAAIAALAERAQKYLGGTTRTAILKGNARSVDLE